MTTNRTISTVLALAAMVAGAACATQPAPRELIDARAAYKRAASGPAVRVNPAQLRLAKDALDAAELAYGSAPAEDVRDRAHVALRRAQAADIMAEAILAAEKRNEAERQLAVLEGKLGDQARADLMATRGQLAGERARASLVEQQAVEERVRAQAAEQRAMTESERARLADAQRQTEQQRATAAAQEAELQRQRVAQTEQQLQVERQAREEAERKAKDALDRLQKEGSTVRRDARGVVITLSGAVLFQSEKSTLLPTAAMRLDDVATALKSSNVTGPVVIEGHTDSTGSRGFNMILSHERAEAVRSYLLSRGVRGDILVARGMGPDRPVAENRTAEGRANNRRVEIILPPTMPAQGTAPAGSTPAAPAPNQVP